MQCMLVPTESGTFYFSLRFVYSRCLKLSICLYLTLYFSILEWEVQYRLPCTSKQHLGLQKPWEDKTEGVSFEDI